MAKINERLFRLIIPDGCYDYLLNAVYADESDVQLNNRVQLNAEIEYNAVSIAQNEIDQLRWLKNETEFENYVNTFPKQKPLPAGDALYYD